jgi:hypothetical protein
LTLGELFAGICMKISVSFKILEFDLIKVDVFSVSGSMQTEGKQLRPFMSLYRSQIAVVNNFIFTFSKAFLSSCS